MSYLEYRMKSAPTGMRKLLHMDWALLIVITAIAGIGWLMLYSIANGNFDLWAKPQMIRYAAGFALLVLIAVLPIWWWRLVSWPAYGIGMVLLVSAIAGHQH